MQASWCVCRTIATGKISEFDLALAVLEFIPNKLLFNHGINIFDELRRSDNLVAIFLNYFVEPLRGGILTHQSDFGPNKFLSDIIVLCFVVFVKFDCHQNVASLRLN